MPRGRQPQRVLGEPLVGEAVLGDRCVALGVDALRPHVRDVPLVLGHGEGLLQHRLVGVGAHVACSIHVVLGPAVEPLAVDVPVLVGSELGGLEVVVVRVVEEPVGPGRSVGHEKFQEYQLLLYFILS